MNTPKMSIAIFLVLIVIMLVVAVYADRCMWNAAHSLCIARYPEAVECIVVRGGYGYTGIPVVLKRR